MRENKFIINIPCALPQVAYNHLCPEYNQVKFTL